MALGFEISFRMHRWVIVKSYRGLGVVLKLDVADALEVTSLPVQSNNMDFLASVFGTMK